MLFSFHFPEATVVAPPHKLLGLLHFFSAYISAQTSLQGE